MATIMKFIQLGTFFYLLHFAHSDSSACPEGELCAVLVSGFTNGGMYGMAAWYDGDDYIYLFGGVQYSGGLTYPRNFIQRLSISSGTLSFLSSMPTTGYYSSVQDDSDGNLLFLGGNVQGSGHTAIIRMNEFNNVSRHEGNLLWSTLRSSSVKSKNIPDTAYIFGGDGNPNGIMYLNTRTLSKSSIGQLPHSYNTLQSILVGNSAYIFGIRTEGPTSTLKVDLENFESSEVGVPDSPKFLYRPGVAYDNQFIYIVGGYEAYSGTPARGLIQYDPFTFLYKYIPINNHPLQNGIHFYCTGPTTVYVEKLKRLYMFGGTSKGSQTQIYERSEIWYVDLSSLYPSTEVPTPTTEETSTSSTSTSLPTSTLSTTTSTETTTTMNPDIFTCQDKTNGLYPHPFDCAMFIGCRDGVMDLFTCPPPLLFNPVNKACDSPDSTECDLSCIGKSDGRYPHPHDCSLFIMCRNEVLDVYKCPPPLLFDRNDFNCNYPDLVVC